MIKCLVAVKRVIDYNANIRVKADGSGIITDQVKMITNPFDEIALEQAQQLQEQGIISEFTAISIGTAATVEILRSALARGATRGILIETSQAEQDSLLSYDVAKILAAVVKREQFNLVLMGKQAIDSDCNQTGQMLSGLLNWSQGTFLSKCTIIGETVRAEREVDNGIEVLELQLPAVLTTDLRLNQPRYLNLLNIAQAKSKPIQTIPLMEIITDLKPRQKRLQVLEKPARNRGVMVADVDSLLDKLHNEVKVL